MKNPKDGFLMGRIRSLKFALKGMWILITTEEKAKQIVDIPVYINGVDSYSNESAIIGIDCAGAGQVDPCE